MKNVFELKISWVLCYRSDLMSRGHNTNNNAEAQFLVIKDKILQRFKEFNVVALFEKLGVELTDHYKNKLLSVASGSYDTYTARRFDGKPNKKGQLGCKVPDNETLISMAARCTDVGLNLIRVLTESEPNVNYVVDTFLGTCECTTVGISSAPCKHQFVVWTSKKRESPNFMPFFCQKQRMRFARMAIGEVVVSDPSLYEGLRKRSEEQMLLPESEIHIQADDDVNISETEPTPGPSHAPDSSALVKELTIDNLDESFKIHRQMLNSSDKSFCEGISNFHKRSNKLQKNQIISALHKFGSNQYLKKINPAAKSIVKKALRKLINVQPSAIQRRKKQNGSKKEFGKGA